MRVSAEGFVPFQVEHDPREGPLNVQLQRAASLAGRVIDHLGHPVAGATVEVVDDATHASLRFADLEYERESSRAYFCPLRSGQ